MLQAPNRQKVAPDGFLIQAMFRIGSLPGRKENSSNGNW